METWLGTAAVITVVLIGLLLVIQLVIMSVLILTITRLLQEVRERIDPLISKADQVLAVVSATAEHAQSKVNTAVDATSKATVSVAGGVEKTTRVAQRVVLWPFVTVLAAADGLRSGVRTWRDARRKCHTPPEPTEQ
jgi:predicted PurR-regulated permease PerM